MRLLLIFHAAVLWAVGPAWAVPVKIRALPCGVPEAAGFALEEAVDGQMAEGRGWRPVLENVTAARAASGLPVVFVPESPVSATQVLLQLVFPGPDPQDWFGKLGVDVTTDPEPGADGRWMPLILETSSAADPALPLAATPVLVLEKRTAPFVLTLRARVPFDGITGFRLRIFPEQTAAGGVALGRGADGSFLLGEFRVEQDLPRSSNIALGRQVYCSRQVERGLPSRHLTDGFYGTWSQPVRNTTDPDAFFQLDLGQNKLLDHVVVRWHQTPGRGAPTQGYELELLTESGGFDGRQSWLGRLRVDGSTRISEEVRAGRGSGEFAGRSLMLHVKGGAGDDPRVAELEVYPALLGTARQWMADGHEIPAPQPRGELEIPPGTSALSFVPDCQDRSAVTRCRWRLEGWRDAWQEAVLGGPVVIQPAPAPGNYQLLIQPLHTDGVWDLSGNPIRVKVLARWWAHLPSAVAAACGLVLAVCAGGWFWLVHRVRKRLARTGKDLALHQARLRISRDMHDEIGARLTSIALLAERTRRQPDAAPQLLDELAGQARSTVEALDTIVWAVNPTHDTPGGLADYLSDYAPQYLSAAGIDCVMDFQLRPDARPLALAVRHQVLMAAKEALQNVVKHSGAGVCRILLTDSGNTLSLVIEDDGKGPGTSGNSVAASHTGIDSMQQRLTEAGGSCVIVSGGSGKGTRVEFSVPLGPAARISG